MTLFMGMLVGMQLIYWWIGRRFGRAVKDEEEYFLAGRSVSWIPLMMTFLATQVGGGIALGAADEAYQFGWPVLLYPLGVALGLICLGRGVGQRLAGYPVSTVAQVLEIAYRSKRLKQGASLLSILSLFMILVAQIIASMRFLSSWGWDNPWIICAFWAVIILYTAQGGLKAVIATDMVQAGVFSCVLLGIGVWMARQASLPALDMSGGMWGVVSPKLTGWLLMPLLFMLIEQDMGQRCFAASSPRIVARATLVAGILTFVVCLVPVGCGMIARSMGVEVLPGQSVLMTVVQCMTPPWVAACAGCAILAAIISTATSLMNAISSNIVGDFAWKKGAMPSIKRMTGGLAVAALVVAFYFDSVVGVLIQSYELSVSCLCVPVLMALRSRYVPSQGAWGAVIAGSIGFIGLRLYPLPIPREVLSLGLSFLGYGMGAWIARSRILATNKGQ